MDQFIMIEFLTPEGVAEYDGLNPFAGTYPLYYNQASIRVIHVDARLGSYNYNNTKKEWQFSGFTTSTNRSGSDNYIGTACSNTATDSCFSNYKLLEILPRTGKSIKTYGAASNETLFVEGDTFGVEGGAWATLGSNAIYLLLLLLYVNWRVGTYPVSWGQLKVLLVGLLMIGLNYLMVFAIGRLVPDPSMIFRIVEALIRTGIVAVIGLLVVYHWKVSPDVVRLIKKLMIRKSDSQ